MGKYYITSGEVRDIVDAPDFVVAAKKVLKKSMESEDINIGMLLSINEKGFNCNEVMLTPVIPLLKKMGFDEQSDGAWLDLLCETFKMSFEQIPARQVKWLITGVLEPTDD